MNKHPLQFISCRVIIGFLTLSVATTIANSQGSAGEGVLNAPSAVNAVAELVSRFPYIVNFEGPRYTYEGDFEDVPKQYQRPGARTERMVKVTPVALSMPASASVSQVQMAAILRQLVDQANATDGGHFRLDQSGKMFNIIATEVRDENGKWTPQPSLFDVHITIPSEQRSAYQMLQAILDAVGVANHTQLGLYDDRPGPLVVFEHLISVQGAKDEVARDVLTRTLAQANRLFAWRTGYDRVTNKYYMTIALVGSNIPVTGAPSSPPQTVSPGKNAQSSGASK